MTFQSSPGKPFDLLVLGDEVESVLTAVSAARAGARVGLLRESTGPLGGLSTRGGLSYMDITPELTSPLFQEFLERAGVQRVALDPERGHAALQAMLDTAEVLVFSGEAYQPVLDESGRVTGVQGEAKTRYQASVYIDATPDADFVRAAGVPACEGLGELFGPAQNFLGVTPVFRLSGITPQALIGFEQQLRQRPDCYEILRQALPHHPETLVREYVTRDPICPQDMDYLDILNPALGVFYHLWRHGEATTYPAAEIWIDGGNISRLPDGTLGVNGMVMRAPQGAGALSQLLAWSHGHSMPPALAEELRQFERFLHEAGGLGEARVLPPQALYVRQTVNVQTRRVMSGVDLFAGGVSETEAVGTFSYWVDFRGINLWEVCPEVMPLPKPVFNVGLDVARFAEPRFSNLAVVGRSAGYSPLAQGACRIVQHNALLGEAVGVAAALAVQLDRVWGDLPAAAVRAAMADRATPLSGHPTLTAPTCLETRLFTRDREIAGCW